MISPSPKTKLKIFIFFPKGSWRKEGLECDPAVDSQCFFVADVNQNNEATCSLGYMGFLPNVNRYCTLNQQWGVNQALPPTKHNVLCQAQGAQEVIQAHQDLKSFELTPKQNFNANVTMRVVREPVTKYVLVLESSSSMIKQDLWKWISKAAQKFIRNDLPDKTQMAIVTFSNESVIQHSLASLTDEEARARIADSIPDKYKVQRSPDQRCVICGIQTAMRQVLSGEEAGAHVILVTRGDNDTLSLTDENLILEFARYYQVKFSSILVPTTKSLSFYDSLSKLSNGRSFVFQAPKRIQDDVGAGLYHNVIEAFYSLRRLDTDLASNVPVNVHSNIVTREVPNLKSSGSFSIDSTLGQDTKFGIIVDDPDDHNIRSVTFTDNGGQMYGPYSSLSNEYNVINMKTINFPKDTPVPPFDDPAHLGLQWKYEVKWYDEGDRKLENVIVVESKPRNLGSFGLIELDMWTTSESTSDIITSDAPMKLFVQVTRGSSPVLAAKVLVSVNVQLQNGTELELEKIPLLDNGNGNPDLQSGDGVYSRYLTDYPGVGRYIFKAYVDDNEAKAYTIQGGRNGRAMPAKPDNPGQNPVCCGSEITVPVDLRRPTGSFKRTLNSGPVLHLIEIPDANSDRMPPSRISDLRLMPDDTGRKLVAKWTAPGDDYDAGQVSKYAFVFSEDIMDLLDSSRQPPILHEVSRQDSAGIDAIYTFTFNNYEKDYHVAMYAIDDVGNKANISNIVLVRLPQPPTTSTGTPTTEGPGNPKDTNWLMIGALSGAILTVLILTLVGLYVYFALAKKRRVASPLKSKSSGVNVDLPQATGSDNSSFDDTKNNSSNHLVPQISTISNAYKSITNGSTSFANGITPTYWSASQLLKEHEERKMRENTIGTIAEENAGYDYNTEPFAYYYDYQNGTETYPYPYPAPPGQRLSTSTAEYQSGAVDYHPDASAIESEYLRNNNKMSVPKTSGNSDNSSSGTLGMANNSLQGSLISVNSGRPPSSVAKTRNITQV